MKPQSENAKRIGLSCQTLVKMYGVDRAFAICKESGFDAVDFNLESYRLGDAVYGGSEDAFVSHFEEIRKKAEDLGLEISQTHGRCVTYRLDDAEYNRKIDQLNQLDLRATSILGAPSCVIHFINNTTLGKQPPSVMHRVSGEMYDVLIPFAEQYGVNIAMESFGASEVRGDRIREFFGDPVEFKRQYDRLATDRKTICIDTGHIHEAESFWVPPPEEMIRFFGKDISILHLHDNSGHWDDHLLPGMGNIKWPAVFDALDEVGYQGVYNFELSYLFAGEMMEDYTHFIGRYLRRFVDNHGKMR